MNEYLSPYSYSRLCLFEGRPDILLQYSSKSVVEATSRQHRGRINLRSKRWLRSRAERDWIPRDRRVPSPSLYDWLT